MRKAEIFVHGVSAGILEELPQQHFKFSYHQHYHEQPVSLTMPLKQRVYEYDTFPSFFEGVLPEGIQLEALLRTCKLDKNDYFGQLLQVGSDLVGAVTVKAIR